MSDTQKKVRVYRIENPAGGDMIVDSWRGVTAFCREIFADAPPEFELQVTITLEQMDEQAFRDLPEWT